MTKQKFWMVLGLAVVLIASLVVCGCMNMSASVVPPVSYSEKHVALKGNIDLVEAQQTPISHLPVYRVYMENGGLTIIRGELEQGGLGAIVVRSPTLIMAIEDLKNKKGHYCEITIGKVSGTDYWEVVDVTVSA